MQSNWSPSCSRASLQLRAETLRAIRQFFLERDVLEVETPLLASAVGTDPQLDFFTTDYRFARQPQKLYLQTSPEFAMKRLLAAGSGSIYQICKAFRNGESGRFHNPEFSLLEWYRVGFDLQRLMQEIIDLMVFLFRPETFVSISQRSYQDVFAQYTGLDALRFSEHDYIACARNNGFAEAVTLCQKDHALWLDFLFSHLVQPQFGENELNLIYGYPACQSSLARLNRDNPLVTDRVEIFVASVELGNGYYELLDPVEQEKRFDQEIGFREKHGLPEVCKDYRLLAALTKGLPECAGMAIGLDRLLMLLSGCRSIDEVLAFPVSRA